MEEHDEGVLVDTTRVPYNDEEEVWVMQNLGVIPFDFFEFYCVKFLNLGYFVIFKIW